MSPMDPPMLERFARPDARWFLDDAFRDGELDCLREWNQQQRCSIAGIWPIGGLAMGTVQHNLLPQVSSNK